MKDDGEAALRREVAEAQAYELKPPPRCDPDERYTLTDLGRRVLNQERSGVPEVEGTELARRRFKEKMDAFRSGGMPGYIGPRAGRDA